MDLEGDLALCDSCAPTRSARPRPAEGWEGAALLRLMFSFPAAEEEWRCDMLHGNLLSSEQELDCCLQGACHLLLD